MVFAKKAQTEAASALVAIIAVIIVLYILFLPAEERESLLNKTTEKEKTEEKTIEEKTLVFEHPGVLDYMRETERDHSIPSVNLYTETKATFLKEIESLYVKNGWFAGKKYVTEFSIADLANTENVLLSFNIKQTHGRLIIKLNDEEIFNSKAALGNVKPIKLPKEFLKENNILEFSVSNTGLAFWSLNEYNLEDVKITADVTDVSKRTSESIFIVSNTEKSNLDESSIRFLPNCLVSEVGKLTISINGKEIYSQIPDCGMLSTIPLLPDYIRSGENKITFSTTQGRYFIDYITIKNKLKKIIYPIYYFEIDEDKMDKIKNNKANVTLFLEFVDGQSKKADISINGHKTYLDTSDSQYNKTINDFIEKGNNYVQIIPRTTLNIVDLKVVWS